MPIPSNDRPTFRKRAKQVRSAETVAVIIEAAARILETQGHGAFSTNAVASRAGVSIGTLYQYFPNKDAIIGALLARETAQLVADAQAAFQLADNEEALTALISAAVAHQFRRPQLARLLDFEEARMPLDAGTQTISVQVTAITAQLLERLALPVEGDKQLAARDVIAIIKGMIDAAGFHAETDTVALTRRVRRAVFGYLLSGDPN